MLGRDDAIKAMWISERIPAGGEAEVKGVAAVCSNPLVGQTEQPAVNSTTHRNTISSFSIDCIYGTSGNEEESEHASTVTNNPISDHSDSFVTTDNPIHSSTDSARNQMFSFQSSNYRQESVRLQPSSINNASIVNGDDDAALFQEYCNLQNSRDDSVYDMTDDVEVAISFDEWKSRRKRFKQGTRGSFVKAFQIFEEREQTARLEKSASVKNTMHLHSADVKNVLAFTRSASTRNIVADSKAQEK